MHHLPLLLVLPLATCLSLPRVVFSDCDGTMLAPDHRLTERTRATLRRLVAAGIPVVPATGRARAGPWTEHVLTEPALKDGKPGIYMNGCSVFVDESDSVDSSTLPASVVEATLAFCASEGVTAVVYSCDEALVDTDNALTIRLVGVGDAPVRRVDDLNAACENVGKMLLLFDDGLDSTALRRSLASVVDDRAGITQALSWMLEVVPLGVNKATAAKRLLEQWGIAPEEAMAIGDGENDAELLRFVGLGVAMGNGAAAAKEAAQYVVPSNDEEGFSVAMETHVLSKMGESS